MREGTDTPALGGLAEAYDSTSHATGPSLGPRWSRWRTSGGDKGRSMSAAGPARSHGCWRSGWERTTSPQSIRLSLSSRHAARVCRLWMCASRWPRSFPSPRTSSTWCSPSLSCSSWTTGTEVSARWRASRGRAVSSPPASGTRAPCHCFVVLGRGAGCGARAGRCLRRGQTRRLSHARRSRRAMGGARAARRLHR